VIAGRVRRSRRRDIPDQWAPSRLGEADRVRRPQDGLDAVAGTGTLEHEEGGFVPRHRLRSHMSQPGQWGQRVWPGVRRAGVPNAEPGADADQRPPQAPQLIFYTGRFGNASTYAVYTGDHLRRLRSRHRGKRRGPLSA